MVALKQVIVSLSFYALAASAWRLRLYDDQRTSSMLVDRSETGATDRCYGITGSDNNKATYYSYVAGRGGANDCGRACRLRVYNNNGCSGTPFIDTWQDVSMRRINSPNNNVASSYYIDCVPKIA